MFDIKEQAATIGSVNVRAEKHGEDFVPACDLGISLNLPSDNLIELHANLRSLLYTKNAQQQDLVAAVQEAPNLRFPQLGPLQWHYEGLGYTAAIKVGIGAQPEISLEDVTVNKIVLAPQEGGTVIVTLRLQFCPAPAQYAMLCPLVQHDVTLTLTPPVTQ